MLGPFRHLALSGLALGLVLVPTSASAAEITGTLDSLQVSEGRMRTVLTVPELPSGEVLDPGSVSVLVDGGEVPASVERAGTGQRAARRAVLLIDVSGSMRGAGIDSARAAAGAFLGAAPADVEVGIVAFNDAPQVLIAPTTDRQAAQGVIDQLVASRETALYDAVAAALASLGTDGDRTLIVLSDGGDTVSSSTLQQALGQLSGSGVRAEVVGFRTDESQDSVLSQMAASGHGRVTTAEDAEGLAKAFTEAAAALSSQLVVSAELPSDVSGDVEIQVIAEAGAEQVVASAVLSLPEAPLAAAAGGRPAGPATAGTVITAPRFLSSSFPIAVLVAVLVFLLVMLVMAPALETTSRRRTRQLELYTVQGRRVRAREELAGGGPDRQFGQPFLDASQKLVQRRGMDQAMALRLDQADLPFRPHEWVVLRVAGALVATAVFALLGAGFLGSIIGLLIGWAASGLYRRFRTSRRHKRFATQLPDALALVASSLQTGFSLPQALDAVAGDVPPPLGTELGRALAETRLGAELEDALDRVSERMNSEDMRWAVMAMRIQRQVGGNLAETLRSTVTTVRERAMLRRTVRALSAEGRLSAYVLIGLPIAMGAYLFITNREYVSVLWSTLLGWLMLILAFVGIVIGSFWMSRVVKVEV